LGWLKAADPDGGKVAVVGAFQQILGILTAPFKLLLKGPTMLIGAPRRIWGMKPPMRAAVLLAVFLLLCTAAVFAKYWTGPRYSRSVEFTWLVAMLALDVITPIAAYYLVRLWLEGDVSKYPDIDRAWEAGVAALAEQGLDLTELPVYVVLGVANEAECSALMGASRIATVVAGAPRGPGPLRWYASSEAIYLVCTGLGRLGRLSELAAASGGSPRGSVGSGGAAANPIAATMVVGGASTRQSYPPSGVPTDATLAGGGPILGTLVAGGGGGGTITDAGGHGAAAPASSGMSRKDAEEQTDRLAYAMHRLKLARQPYCANNGLLTVVPHAALGNVVFAREIPEAVRADLDAVRAATRLYSPVTLLVAGMEAEAGFTELVRRVGTERARSSRFGKGFDVWNVASDENMDALSLHACGSFEDWVYTLFSSDDGTEPRSNGKLYEMLCRVRRHLQPRLRGMLVNGYALESEGDDQAPRLFSGCYFAATGRPGEQQAFVRSVFDKLDQLANELQWSDEARREESAYLWVLRLLSLVNFALLAVVIYFLYKLIYIATS
jgi:hypothetical protein